MPLDQLSIFSAIGLSSAALALTLFVSWMVGRSDAYLLTWSIGLAVIVVGVVLFAGFGDSYNAGLQLASFLLLICGFGLVYAGSAQFCSERSRWSCAIRATAAGLLPTLGAFALGFSGAGTIAANLAIALLLALNAYEYWNARNEAALLMVSNAVLYLITAISFVACACVLAWHGQLVLDARPSNWAEEFNAIAIIIGLTGIGALSLTIHQTRIANRHRSESMTDPLTGLHNRRALFGRRTDDVAREAAVVVMDLDHFKAINDRFGHAAGDRVLRAFAEIILSNIRASDLAVRLGGEEFCVLLSDIGAAAAMAERIRSQFEAKTFVTPAGAIRATVSAGIAVRSSDAETVQAMVDRADMALYQAKEAGRNRVHIFGVPCAARSVEAPRAIEPASPEKISPPLSV
ncbi:diguanylate cyclase [Rhodopseudomonas sp. RCAM05734]|uniref:diguanylate cyclase n=1 Tax=Rhodopseudomonas sp. RCAM05734 TaxID=3457549 RepID=UPI00404433C1